MTSPFSIENLLRPNSPELIVLYEKLNKPTTPPEMSFNMHLLQRVPFWYPAPQIALNQGVYFVQGNVAPGIQFVNPLRATDTYRRNIEIPMYMRRPGKFSELQWQELESKFQRQKYLNREERVELAKRLELRQIQVGNWFQNRRRKMREQKKKTDKQKKAACGPRIFNSLSEMLNS